MGNRKTSSYQYKTNLNEWEIKRDWRRRYSSNVRLHLKFRLEIDFRRFSEPTTMNQVITAQTTEWIDDRNGPPFVEFTFFYRSQGLISGKKSWWIEKLREMGLVPGAQSQVLIQEKEVTENSSKGETITKKKSVWRFWSWPWQLHSTLRGVGSWLLCGTTWSILLLSPFFDEAHTRCIFGFHFDSRVIRLSVTAFRLLYFNPACSTMPLPCPYHALSTIEEFCNGLDARITAPVTEMVGDCHWH